MLLNVQDKITPFLWYDSQAREAAEPYLRAPSPCGWLKDRFGLSWQIVPKAFLRMMGSGDGPRVARVMKAMLTMTKLDISALQAVHDGR